VTEIPSVLAVDSIQQRLFPTLTCFGCGQASVGGLHLKSYPGPEGVVATFTPRPEHDNGLGFLNGGIISTVLDCHTAAVVMSEAFDRGWLKADSAPLAFVTAGFDVRFLRPTPLGPAVDLWARAESIAEDEMTVLGELRHDGKVRVTMRATWKRWRPRRV
jgi:acyl-coenzyme A thioesterase PaaI-like protein